MFEIIKSNSLWFVCLLAFVASGCAETAMMYRGNTVSSVPVVTLQENGPNAGTWETFDLTIEYEYAQDDNVLEITGEVALTQHYQIIYDRLRRLYVYMFFVDENSQVLETISFVGIMSGSTEERRRLSRRYMVPTGAVGISFGYEGAVGGWDSSWSFYKLPLSK